MSARKDLKKIVFVDRDGTLAFEPPDTFQINGVEQLRILPGVIEELRRLRGEGYELVMVTNQDGLGTEKNPQDNFDTVQNELLRLFREENIEFTEVFICKHFPEESCNCRKPKIGILGDFLTREPVDLQLSVMIGDRKTDQEFAFNIGVRFVGMETNSSFPTV